MKKTDFLLLLMGVFVLAVGVQWPKKGQVLGVSRDVLIEKIVNTSPEIIVAKKATLGGSLKQEKGVFELVRKEEKIRGVDTVPVVDGFWLREVDEDLSKIIVEAKLPIPSGDDYYELWAVDPEPFKLVTLGPLIINDGRYRFEVVGKLTDFPLLYISIEANDGNPMVGELVYASVTRREK